MNIIVKRDYHKIPKSAREYGYECKNCGSVFTFTGNETLYEVTATHCPNCQEVSTIKEWTWLRNKKEVDQFMRLHVALNEE